MYDHLKEMKPKDINPNSDLEVETLIGGDFYCNFIWTR